ncbi:MAG: methionyl-tRNA formyltransferase [Salinivirgaceae bacterium]|nr:methionyl-tRNA formyltransferase [Salinivirgaceae bacterium]
MGTPDFAVESLKALVENDFNIVGVITSPDKPAGRGQKINESAVKKYAKEQNLHILQPTNLKDSSFQEELKALNADLQIIVAFRMLPESVWSMPKLGSINLHGSLLPQYRGAAPINWAVINGEDKTGVTTFFLKHEIDTGDILFKEEIEISNNDTAGTIHDKLMLVGANLLVKTTESIIENNYSETPQHSLIEKEIKHAPKIFKADCKINWNQNTQSIHNLIRGLSPYPTAWTDIIDTTGKKTSVKIFYTNSEINSHNYSCGKIIVEGKNSLKIAAKDGFIVVHELQLAGKKRMNTSAFLQGFQNIENYKFE